MPDLSIIVAIYIVSILLIEVHSFNKTPSRKINYITRCRLSAEAKAFTVEEIKDELQTYLSLRGTTNFIDVNSSINRSSTESTDKDENPFEFLRPTGWFRDEYKLDIEKRSDKRIPKISHPLSFIELEKYGYGKLSESIMSLGGPHLVGLAIGLDWKEPVEVFVVDESLRPKREETYAFDVAGSLSIGGSLEEKLEAAAALDLEKLKRDIETSNNDQDIFGLTNQDADEIDYRRRKLSKAKKVDSQNEIERDKFYLDFSQRAYCLTVFMSFALGNGHASADLLAQLPDSGVGQLVDVFKIISSAMVASSFACAGFAASEAQKKNRQIMVWVFKGLLGGPLSLIEIRQAEARTSP